MTLNINLLKEICVTPGTSGDEERIRKVILREIKGLVDKVDIDHMGNVIALKKGKSSEKKAMAAAHMDEIGFMITHIDKMGFGHFKPIGGFDPKTLTAQRVIIHGKKDIIGVMGSKAVHVMSPEEKKKSPELKDYFIDFGLPEKEVKKLISVGDFITRDRDLIEMGDNVCTKSIDNRVSVFILIETLRTLKKKKPAYDFYATFTVQEEVGMRGAKTAAYKINPDFAFGLDVTAASDTPGTAEKDYCTKLGEGTAIKVMDGGTISDVRMVRFMEKIAKAKKIKYQKEVMLAGGTDTFAMQLAGDGCIAGAISIPNRYMHTVVEMSNKKDVDGAVKLLTACLQDLDSFNMKW